MKKQVSGRSRTFFIEFLIVLFFFLIIGTVCLRVFVAAHKVTRDADALSHAQSVAASIAEVLEAGEDIGDYFPEASLVTEGTAEGADADGTADTASGADADDTVNIASGTDGYGTVDADGEQIECYRMTWDSDFTACSADSASVFYTLTLEINTAGHMQTASMTFTDSSGETLYELSVTCHQPFTREEALS